MSLLPPFLAWRAPHHFVTYVRFCGYTTPEIEGLSVKEVTETATFDELGHPQPGGMYDAAFGPNDWHETCVTCGLPETQCPGHVGHIALVMPTFHPIYFKFVFQLLKGSCVFCHRMFCSSDSLAARVLMYQLDLLDMGYLTAAEEMAEACSRVEEAAEGVDIHFNKAMALLDRINKSYTEILERHGGKREFDKSNNRNQVEVRGQLIQKFLKAHMYKRVGTCPYCRRKSPSFKTEYNKFVILDFTVKKAKKGNQDILAERTAAIAAQKSLQRSVEQSKAQSIMNKLMGLPAGSNPTESASEEAKSLPTEPPEESQSVKLGIEGQLDSVLRDYTQIRLAVSL